MTKAKMEFRELAHKLDHSLGGINLATETLDDISTNLLHVVESMDNVPDVKDLRLFFNEWHRDLRILAKLMYHASNDLVAGNEEAKVISEQIFDEVVRNEK